MATGYEHAQREADFGGISLASFGVSSGADGVVAPETVINEDSAHRFRAYELDYVKVLAQFRRAVALTECGVASLRGAVIRWRGRVR